jgi:MarR family transcriptional regulator, transcriptional regulator for hemolysin
MYWCIILLGTAMQDEQQLRDGFGALVSRAARQWRRAVDRRLQPFGLTEATWLPLIYLARAEAPMRQKDLAAVMTLDGSSVVRLLDALEASELIGRSEENADRRAKIVTITARGWAIIEQVEIIARDVRNATLDGLSGNDLRIAARVLDTVCGNLARQLEQDA